MKPTRLAAIITLLGTAAFGNYPLQGEAPLPPEGRPASQVVVQIRADNTYQVGGTSIKSSELPVALRVLGGLRDKPAIVVKADVGTPYSRVVEVLDGCREASLVQVAFATVSAQGANKEPVPANQGGLRILAAFFGADGSWRDVSDLLRKSVAHDSLRISWEQPFTEAGGDPAFGKIKTLVVSYQLGPETRLAGFQEKGDGSAMQATIQ